MTGLLSGGIFAFVTLAIVFAGAAIAQNRQAISTSLTECNVIFSELAEVAARRGKPQDEIDTALTSATLFLIEARAEARREGQHQPHTHIQAEAERLAEKWDGRFSRVFLLRENKDWIDYCRALGGSRGIALP